MAFTSHGHHIVGSKFEKYPADHRLARCGGPSVCVQCSNEAEAWIASHKPEVEGYYDIETLDKVYKVLWKNGISYDTAIEIINQMQNEGILFRKMKTDG